MAHEVTVTVLDKTKMIGVDDAATVANLVDALIAQGKDYKNLGVDHLTKDVTVTRQGDDIHGQ